MFSLRYSNFVQLFSWMNSCEFRYSRNKTTLPLEKQMHVVSVFKATYFSRLTSLSMLWQLQLHEREPMSHQIIKQAITTTLAYHQPTIHSHCSLLKLGPTSWRTRCPLHFHEIRTLPYLDEGHSFFKNTFYQSCCTKEETKLETRNELNAGWKGRTSQAHVLQAFCRVCTTFRKWNGLKLLTSAAYS